MSDPLTPTATAGDGDGGPSSDAGLWARLKALLTGRQGEPSLRRSLSEAIEDQPDHAAADDIGDEERMILKNILANGRLRVDDVMIPRVDIVAFDIEEPFEALVALLCEAEHSRLPVYRGSLDEVVGMVHIKDVIKPIAGADQTRPAVAGLLRPVLYVAPSMRIMDLLAKMRAERVHMAVVIDEYGGTDGLVTIEDLVEQVVGDIADEHDELEPDPMRRLAIGVYDLDARLAIPDLEAELGTGLLPAGEDEDIDTVGGLVVLLAGRVPAIGEVIEHPHGLRFEVVDGDPRRIKRLRLYRVADQNGAVDA